MTREEYIDFANALKNNYTIDFDKIPEFCDMAISALSENKGDLISRQAVEDITWEEPSYTDPLNVLTEVREKVRALPSVENKCFEGTTKGEVFMSLFPNAVDEEQAKWFFGLDWWNAPYKAESEETE